MPQSSPTAIHFSSEKVANALVAGIPACARALAVLASEDENLCEIRVAVPGGWKPSEYCQSEAKRLAGRVDWHATDETDPAEGLTVIGVNLLDQNAQRGLERESEAEEFKALNLASRRIIGSTGKAADGIVSRHINRPISQFLTSLMLRSSRTRPGHATAIAALIGALMITALIFGGSHGLLAGAVLFQLASIIDGVDGEMARATQRSSDRGAMLDSLTDAVTNLGFLAGVSFNVWQQGFEAAAAAGTLGFIALALGSAILGMQARRAGGPFTFDALKHQMRVKPTKFKQALIYITMRDFYALAACLAILAGAAVPLLYIFAFVASGWFVVVCYSLAFKRNTSNLQS